VLGGVASSIASRTIAAISPLLLVPLTLNYLGAELYGLWVSIVALTSMALWADLGLGNGLLTRLTPVLTVGDRPAARRLVSTGYAGLLVVSSTAILALLLLSWTTPWASVLNIESADAASKAPAMALITIGGFLVNIPLSLIQRVQYANQQVSQSNWWQASGSLSSVAGAWAAVHAGLGTYWVVGAVAAGPVVGNMVNSWWFYRRNADLLPSLREADRRAARSLFGLGGKFFLISAVSSVALNADNLVIANTLGLEAVSEYSVPYRALSALGLLVTLINLPLWPANGEALAQGDTGWVRRITRRMTFLSVVGVLVPGAIIVAFSEPMFRLWLGASSTTPAPDLVLLLAIWWACLAAASPRFMVQNATGLMRPQLRGWVLFSALSLPLKFIGAQQIGLNGVVLAGITCYVTIMWPTAMLGYRAAIKIPDTRADTSDAACANVQHRRWQPRPTDPRLPGNV